MATPRELRIDGNLGEAARPVTGYDIKLEGAAETATTSIRGLAGARRPIFDGGSGPELDHYL
jgi:hypothetical protein